MLELYKEQVKKLNTNLESYHFVISNLERELMNLKKGTVNYIRLIEAKIIYL